MKLKDKVAVITGGSRGFGRSTALAFAKEGANLVLAAMAQDLDEMESVVKEVEAIGTNAISVATDVSKKEQVENMASKAFDAFGKVDILVNNAGIGIHGDIAEIPEDIWDKTMDVNLKGVFLCTQAIFPHMCNQKSGHIINIGSISGQKTAGKFATYTASKYAVNGFNGVTDAEGIPYGVKATLICPGPADTKLRAQNHNDDLDTLLKPEDIAEAILYVVSQPDRVYIPEITIHAQHLKKPPHVNNLKDNI